MTDSNNTPAAKADERDWRGPLWDAVDSYVRACRGDPSKYVYGNTPRQRAVAEAEQAVKDALLRAKLEVLGQLDDYATCLSEARRCCQSPDGDEYEDAINRLTDELRSQLTATDSGTEGTL